MKKLFFVLTIVCAYFISVSNVNATDVKKEKKNTTVTVVKENKTNQSSKATVKEENAADAKVTGKKCCSDNAKAEGEHKGCSEEQKKSCASGGKSCNHHELK